MACILRACRSAFERRAPFRHRARQSREEEDRERRAEKREHRQLDVLRLDLLAEIFRRPADHQARHEHREDRVE